MTTTTSTGSEPVFNVQLTQRQIDHLLNAMSHDTHPFSSCPPMTVRPDGQGHELVEGGCPDIRRAIRKAIGVPDRSEVKLSTGRGAAYQAADPNASTVVTCHMCHADQLLMPVCRHCNGTGREPVHA